MVVISPRNQASYIIGFSEDTREPDPPVKIAEGSLPIRHFLEVVSNVVREGTSPVVDRLISTEQVYINWFSYNARSHNILAARFR